MGVHPSVTARHSGTQYGYLIPQIYSLIPTIPKNLLPKSSPPHPLSQIFQKKAHTDSTDSTNKSLNGMLLVPPVDLQTYYSLTCWLVDSLTLKKIGAKIPNSPEVVGGGG